MFMTSNAVHYLGEDSLIHFDNAHIPLLVTFPPQESMQSFLLRSRTIIQTLYMSSFDSADEKRSEHSSSQFPVDVKRMDESVFFRVLREDEKYACCYEKSILPIIRRMDQTRCRFTEVDSMAHVCFLDCSIVGEDCSKPAIDVFSAMKTLSQDSVPCITNIYMLSRKTKVPEAMEAYFDMLAPSRIDEIHQAIKQKIDILLNMLVRRRIRRDTASPIQLTECLTNSLTSEAVEMCDHCKEKTVRDIQNRITQLPPILVILLKRFSYDIYKSRSVSLFGNRNKITDFVSFPIEGLDMSPYSIGCSSTLYDLICVCNHQGSADFGHYYAYCRSAHQGSERWYEYNDDFVQEIQPSSVQTENAYILMYRQRDLPSLREFDLSDVLQIATDGRESKSLRDVAKTPKVASSSTLSERSTKRMQYTDSSSVSSDAELSDLKGFQPLDAEIAANRHMRINCMFESGCLTVAHYLKFFMIFMLIVVVVSLCSIIIVIIVL